MKNNVVFWVVLALALSLAGCPKTDLAETKAARSALTQELATAKGLLDSKVTGNEVGDVSPQAKDGFLKAIDSASKVLDNPKALLTDLESAGQALKQAEHDFQMSVLTAEGSQLERSLEAAKALRDRIQVGTGPGQVPPDAMAAFEAAYKAAQAILNDPSSTEEQKRQARIALEQAEAALRSARILAPAVLREPQDEYSPYLGVLKDVPAGSFQRDNDPGDISTVSEFRMSVTLITAEEYSAITGLPNPSGYFINVKNGPVQMVSWYEALVFCNQLSLKEGLKPVYNLKGQIDPRLWGDVPAGPNLAWDHVDADWSANGYRLPTEMEQMWASMGANLDKKPGDMVNGVNVGGWNKDFAGSDGNKLLTNFAWYSDNSGQSPHAVTDASGRPEHANELGLGDMSGNLWQWCWDWYDYYPSGKIVDYRGPDTGAFKVVKGGSWNYDASYCAVASRFYNLDYGRSNSLGFRVVRR